MVAVGRAAVVTGVTALREYVTQPNDHGAVGGYVVIGAGNGGFRGQQLEALGLFKSRKTADQIGLTGTIMNAMFARDALEEANVPHAMLISPGVEFRMPGMSDCDIATPANVQACIKKGLVPVIGAGSGELGQSTDSAVLDHAVRYRDHTGEAVEVLKATRHGGVFDRNPDEPPKEGTPARLIAQVSAAAMLENGWFAVDEPCLNAIKRTRIPMLLHGFDTSIPDALSGAGTLVLPSADAELVYA